MTTIKLKQRAEARRMICIRVHKGNRKKQPARVAWMGRHAGWTRFGREVVHHMTGKNR